MKITVHIPVIILHCIDSLCCLKNLSSVFYTRKSGPCFYNEPVTGGSIPVKQVKLILSLKSTNK